LIQGNEGRQRYVYPGSAKDLKVEDVSKFLDDVKAGKIEEFFKSEDIPASNDEPVKILVAKEFEKIVRDPTKDVLVMFYAPWCGHCKKLKPIWDELAKEMMEINKDIVITKMDSTLNEVTGIAIKSYPTIKFYPKDNKKGEDVKAGRTLEGMKTYLEENASAKTV